MAQRASYFTKRPTQVYLRAPGAGGSGASGPGPGVDRDRDFDFQQRVVGRPQRSSLLRWVLPRTLSRARLKECVGDGGRARNTALLNPRASGTAGTRQVVAAKVEDSRSNYFCFYHCHWKVPDRLLK